MSGLNYFLRRIDSDVLNKCSERYNSIKENYPQSLTWFKNFVTSTLIMSVERMIELETEEGSRKIQDSLIDYYADEIEKRWNELQEVGIRESITRILREEINPVLRKVIRRIAAIDWEIEFAVKEVKRQNNVCFMGEDDFIETVIEKTIDSMYWDFFSDIDDNSKEWTSAYYFMKQYINDNFVDKLRQNYQLNCNKQVETNESELTEKCWAGYTQKGMKTMFGKRYPNCVKKTKK